MPLPILLALGLIILLVILRPKSANNLIHLNLPVRRKQKAAISANRFDTLVKMVGRHDIARKLVQSNLEKYPNRSPSWACNKAISDIEKEKRI